MSNRKLIVSTVGAQVCRTFFTLLSGPIMSRLIGPAAYGVFAPAQSVALLGKLVTESGFSAHTATAPDLTPGQIRGLHNQSFRFASGVACLAGLVAFSLGSVPLWERFARALFTIILILAAGTNAVPLAWAQRNRNLSRLEWYGTAFQIVTTLAIALPLAYFGFRYLAVSSNIVLPAIALAVATWSLAKIGKESPTPVEVPKKYRGSVLAANVVSYLALNIDVIILASYLSATEVGVYSRALLLSSLPGTVITVSLAKIGFAVVSQSKDRKTKLRYLVKSNAVTFLGFAPLVALAAFGFDIPGFAFGRSFGLPPLAFLLISLAQSFNFAASLHDTDQRANRDHGAVIASLSVQTVILAAVLGIARPHDWQTIGFIHVTAALIRFAIVTFKSISSARATSVPEPVPSG